MESIKVWSNGQECSLNSGTYASNIETVKHGVNKDLINKNIADINIQDLVDAKIVTTDKRSVMFFDREISVVSYKLHLNDVNFLTFFNTNASGLLTHSIKLVNAEKNIEKANFESTLNTAKEEYITKQTADLVKNQISRINQALESNETRNNELDKSLNYDDAVSTATNKANEEIDEKKNNLLLINQ